MIFCTVNKKGQELVTRYWDEERIAQRAQNEPDKIFFLPECWENLIESLRYKPLWMFCHHYDIDYMVERLHITILVPDRDDPSEQIEISKTFVLPSWPDSIHLAREIIRECVASIEFHEMNENITFDGERTFDPHRED